MEKLEQMKPFSIEAPRVGDEIALAPMHLQAWKESYITPDSGLTSEKIDSMLGEMLADIDFRKNTIAESLSNPDKVLYRVVKNSSGSIVGFLHGDKNETCNELEGLYLLDEVKGSGVGGTLMEEFLSWIDAKKPCRLDVFSFNERAIAFYTKYGFKKTDEPAQMYKDTLPFIEMVRPTVK